MSGRFLRKENPSTIAHKLALKAVLERNLVCEGDRILIAASGGKDSTVMAWALAAIRPALKCNYELAAMHVATDLDGGMEGNAKCKNPALAQRLAEWDIPFTELFVPVIGRLKEGEKMNCYWCSTQRRTELLKYAVENGFNKIALGHHLDDIIETFFMNLCAKGEMSAMPIVLKYRKFPVSLIRPLAYLEERQIIACADAQNFLKTTCTCPYGVNSGRREMRQRIADFTGNSGAMKRRILSALASGERDLLVE
ncbi:MAG: tRNA 2-thiocytidine biosynthesis TtcA family protein [Treponema sp.]|nr:tRNA 2-thiocytidine biosynthesis TtcA family protein [Treponema sp.]